MSNIKSLSPQCFKPYGKIIFYPGKSRKGNVRNLWRIVHVERARVGWRIAYLVLRDKSIGRLERHPCSDETFEPVHGRVLLFVSQAKDIGSVQCFLLDRPIVLRKGIWHGLISLDKEAEIKITENNTVACQHWPLGFRAQGLADFQK